MHRSIPNISFIQWVSFFSSQNWNILVWLYLPFLALISMIFNILYFLWVYLSHGMSNEKSVVGWEFPLEYFPLFKWGKKKKKVGKDHYTILDIMVRKKKNTFRKFNKWRKDFNMGVVEIYHVINDKFSTLSSTWFCLFFWVNPK